MTFVRGDRSLQPSALPVGEVLGPAAQDGADAVERVVLAATVAMDLLLDPAADLIDRGGADLDHVKGVQHRNRVLEVIVDGVLVAVERIEGGDLDAVTERFAASCSQSL